MCTVSAGAHVRDALLVGLAEGLVGIFGLLLEQLEPPLQGLVLCASAGALVGSLLEVLNSSLELLDLGLEEPVLVRQRGDFLLLGEVLLLEGLDAGLELLDLGRSLVGLQAEGVHLLQWGTKPSARYRDIRGYPSTGRWWGKSERGRKLTSLMRSMVAVFTKGLRVFVGSVASAADDVSTMKV